MPCTTNAYLPEVLGPGPPHPRDHDRGHGMVIAAAAPVLRAGGHYGALAHTYRCHTETEDGAAVRCADVAGSVTEKAASDSGDRRLRWTCRTKRMEDRERNVELRHVFFLFGRHGRPGKALWRWWGQLNSILLSHAPCPQQSAGIC